MPDSPDWQRYLPGSERYALSDMGELAARLGSPLRFDRRGEVVWYDEFEHGLNPWYKDSTGTGASVAETTAGTYMSVKAALLTCGSNGGQEATIFKNLTPPAIGRWGVEVAVAFTSTFDNFQIKFMYWNGANLYDSRVYLSDADDEIKYFDENTNLIKLDDLGELAVTETNYRLLKLVCDFDKGEYVSLRLGPVEYDMSGIPIRSTTSTLPAKVQTYFRLIGRSGQNDTAQIGHGIFTANEP